MKILTSQKMLLSLLLLMFIAPSVQADCQNSIPASAPDGDFTVHDNGTVTHNTTGLMWMRCSLGESWNGSACGGSARTYTWIDALAAAQSHTFAAYSDWQLPNKNELASIVEHRCEHPAANTVIFPNTPYIGFWSSTPAVNGSNNAWGVDFDYGKVRMYDKGNVRRVRLVRAGQ